MKMTMIEKIKGFSNKDLAMIIGSCNSQKGLSLIEHPDYSGISMEWWHQICVSEYELRQLTPAWHTLPAVDVVAEINAELIRQVDFDDADYNGEKVALCLTVNDEPVCVMEDGIHKLYELMENDKSDPNIRLYPIFNKDATELFSLNKYSKYRHLGDMI